MKKKPCTNREVRSDKIKIRQDKNETTKSVGQIKFHVSQWKKIIMFYLKQEHLNPILGLLQIKLFL